MIVVNVAVKQEEIKNAIESIPEPKFTFVKKDRLKLYFECDNTDNSKAAAIVKRTIKENPSFSAIFFSIDIE